jgi:ATP-binding cassette subfamily B (MDR/TAP) protein 1
VGVETATSLLFGVAFAFYWSWPMALVCLGITPFIMISGVISAKADNASIGLEEADGGEDAKTDETKDS